MLSYLQLCGYGRYCYIAENVPSRIEIARKNGKIDAHSECASFRLINLIIM